MNANNQARLYTEMVRHKYLRRLQIGFGVMKQSEKKQTLVKRILVVSAALWLLRRLIIPLFYPDVLEKMMIDLYGFMIPMLTIIILGVLLIHFGTPPNAELISRNLQRAGIFNQAEEAPILISAQMVPKFEKIVALEFYGIGIPLAIWEEKQAEVEAALNIYIAKIKQGPDRRTVLIYAAPADHAFPEMIRWDDRFIPQETSKLVLGAGLTGKVTVDLSKVPHILIGGSTGSGKTILLKNLLYQGVKKNMEVIIADFKGGADYSRWWEEHTTMCFDENALQDQLLYLTRELQERKQLFREKNCPNIDTYNAGASSPLSRIIFACDEVAELLDKTGLDKSQKDKVAQIESALSTIARQGRAFGIHLILATQRPDANVISGQIKNNLDCRICGRADKVLAQIILDNSEAADLIPKDAQGRFIVQDGTVFQGYYMEELR